MGASEAERVERRAAVQRMVDDGMRSGEIAAALGVAKTTVKEDRVALGCPASRKALVHPEWRPLIAEYTERGMKSKDIAHLVGCTSRAVYQIQIELGIIERRGWSDAQRAAVARGSARNHEHAQTRKRKGVRCSHCGGPADPECRWRRRDWCARCLLELAEDVDPNYEARQREAHYRGGGATALSWKEKRQLFSERNGFGECRTYEETYNELLALGPHPEPDDVDRVIGNASWTRLHCDGCGESVDAVITVGQEPDYESATASLCPKCMAEAVAEWRRVFEEVHR